MGARGVGARICCTTSCVTLAVVNSTVLDAYKPVSSRFALPLCSYHNKIKCKDRRRSSQTPGREKLRSPPVSTVCWAPAAESAGLPRRPGGLRPQGCCRKDWVPFFRDVFWDKRKQTENEQHGHRDLAGL